MKEEKRINLFKQSKLKPALPLLYWERMVQEIIDNNCNDHSKIESNFDALTPYLSNEKISHLYIQLLEYYKNIDSEGAAYYWEIFDTDFKNDTSFILENSTTIADFENDDFFYD